MKIAKKVTPAAKAEKLPGDVLAVLRTKNPDWTAQMSEALRRIIKKREQSKVGRAGRCHRPEPVPLSEIIDCGND